MKKLILLTLTLVLLIASGSAGAQSTVDLTKLAIYAPVNTSFYAAIRTDEGHIDALDAIVTPIFEQIARNQEQPITLRYVINQTMFPGRYDWDNDVFVESPYTFEENVRPWLGDSMAVFAVLEDVEALDSGQPRDVPMGMIIDITDKAGAVEFLTQQMANGLEYGDIKIVEQVDGSTLFESHYLYTPNVLVNDVAIFISYGPFMFTNATLIGNENMSNLLAALPAQDYNAIVYTDFVPLAQSAQRLIAEDGEVPPQLVNAFDVTVIGQQVLGFTILNGRTLAVDTVTNSTAFPQLADLNLSFLEHVPAGTALLMQHSGMGDHVNYIFNQLRNLDSYLEEVGFLPLPEDAGPLQNIQFGHLSTFAMLSFEGTTGLNFYETLASMNGDAATFVRLPIGEAAPTLYDYSLGFGVEFGAVMATSNPEVSAELVAVAAEMAQDMWATTTFENGVVRIPLGDIVSQPQIGEMAVGSNDTVIAAGYHASVDFALNPTGENITTAPNFIYEQQLFMENPSVLFFLDMAPVEAAVMVFMETNPGVLSENEVGMIQNLLSALKSGAISIAQDKGLITSRATLSFGNPAGE